MTTEVLARRGRNVPAAPRVSVIIPAYQPTWLEEALASVRAQSFRDYEIIVVDDGSPEPVVPAETADLVLARQPNAGPGAARNRGVELARGHYVALLDSDDVWRPEKLASQVALHERRPGCVLSSTDLAALGGGGGSLLARLGLKGESIGFEQLFYENCIPCSSAVVVRSAWLRAGGMPVARRLAEDYALWLRLGRLGEIGHVDQVLTLRRQHAASLSRVGLREGAFLAAERAVYDEFLAEHPDLRGRPFVRRALARLEFEAGYECLKRRDFQAARGALLRSVARQPAQLRAWISLARSVLRL